MNEYPTCSGTALSLSCKTHTTYNTTHRLLNIRILSDNHRALTAKLHSRGNKSLPRFCSNASASGCGSSKTHLLNILMRYKSRTSRHTSTTNDIDDSLRKQIPDQLDSFKH